MNASGFRPLAILEWHQFRQGFLHALLVIGGAAIALRYFNFGLLISLVLLPNVASGIGMGTFNEEYQKGKMRFLHTLPIPHSAIWFAKVTAGLLGVVFFLVYIETIVRFYPASGPDLPRQFLYARLEVGEMGFHLLSLSMSLYTYFVGVVVVSLCVLPRNAALLNQLLIYVPLAIFWYAGKKYSIEPTGSQIAAILGLTCLPMSLGSYALMRMRNPYLEPGKHFRMAGAVCIGVALLLLSGLVATMEAWSKPVAPVYGENIMAIIPSPNGSHIAVSALTKRGQHYAYVLGRDGKLVKDLGMNLTPLGTGYESSRAGGAAWKPATNETVILCQSLQPMKANEDAENSRPKHLPLKIIHILTNEAREIKSIDTADAKSNITYSGWLPETDDLLAMETRSHKGGASYTAIRHNTRTGTTERIELVREEKGTISQVLPNGMAMVRKENSKSTVTLVDLKSGNKRELDLKTDVLSLSWSPHGDQFACVQRILADSNVRHQILIGDTATGETRSLVDSGALPEGTVADVMGGKLGNIGAQFTNRGPWVMITIWTSQHQTSQFLVHRETGATVPLKLSEGADTLGATPQFSPSGKRFFITCAEEQADATAYSPRNTRLEIFEISDGKMQKLGACALDGQAHLFAWLDDQEILYGVSKIDVTALSFGATLRCLNLERKTDRPFLNHGPAPPVEAPINLAVK
ncbi:MAG: ABC transporter permease [Verrucomicrobia bacterium]|nr:ABC transporter permease [Verrucomicrobiota bacterium]